MLMLFRHQAVIPMWLVVFGLFALSGSSMTFATAVFVLLLGTLALTIMLAVEGTASHNRRGAASGGRVIVSTSIDSYGRWAIAPAETPIGHKTRVGGRAERGNARSPFHKLLGLLDDAADVAACDLAVPARDSPGWRARGTAGAAAD